MDKDIRFTEKKVDSSWKEQVWKEKGSERPAVSDPKSPSPAKPSSAARPETPKGKPTAKAFLNLATSLGLQALMHLGEMPNPETQQIEINLEAAKELIDLLVEFKEKTEGNLSAEEMQFFQRFLPELQLKYANQIS